MLRSCLIVLAALFSPVFALTAPSRANNPPNPPTITQPANDGDIVSPETIQMSVGAFSDPDAGDTLLCTDWQIWTISPPELIWSASCATGAAASEVHLSDGN